MFRPPSMNGLNRPVVALYRKREMAGTITDFYLIQKSARIVGELGSLVKIPIHFLEKREIFGFHTISPECENGYQLSVIGYQLQAGALLGENLLSDNRKVFRMKFK